MRKQELTIVESCIMLDTLHQELCPHVTWNKVTERVQTIKVQLKREIMSLPTCIPEHVSLECPMCKNTDETKFIVDDGEGSQICLGSDGLGCGCVVLERELKNAYVHQEVFIDPCELYSEQQAFSSEWKECRYATNKRLNRIVERNLSRYSSNHTVTSDVYKDNQRRDVYDIIDKVATKVGVDGRFTDQVKMLFHDYRTKMYRVHNKEVAILALFRIVFELNSYL